MGIMQENESQDRFVEGLKIASARFRELAALTKNNDLVKVAYQLDVMRERGLKLWKAKQLSMVEKEAILALREQKLMENK